MVVPVVQFGQGLRHLKALGHRTLIISVLDKSYDVTSFYRLKCYKDCWNWSSNFVVSVCVDKGFYSVQILLKHCFQSILSNTCTFYRALSLFGDIMSLKYCEFRLILSPFFSGVNRDFQLDSVNFVWNLCEWVFLYVCA